MKIYNLIDTKENRRDLRKNQTDAEKLLWNKLRNKQFFGLKFFRQYGIGQYIADFYCPKIKLVIEIDGGQHYKEDGIIYDKKREDHFTERAIRTIRFSNIDVLKNIERVLEKIKEELPLTPL
ncbi:endonuclease domain-containing protein [Candidatus Poribacteria bacterium]|nr:endonuclease domain-containing protein [Candidatus Poribacteria bacterium]